MFEQENRGLVVWLDFERQRLMAERCTWVPGFGWGRFVLEQMGHAQEIRILQQLRLTLRTQQWLPLRVMVRDRYLEVYLAERWMLTLDTGGHPRSGGVELTVERGQASFRGLSLATLPPLEEAVRQGSPLP
jgi:hypothetical protein